MVMSQMKIPVRGSLNMEFDLLFGLYLKLLLVFTWVVLCANFSIVKHILNFQKQLKIYHRKLRNAPLKPLRIKASRFGKPLF